jgi:hypothetical protein
MKTRPPPINKINQEESVQLSKLSKLLMVLGIVLFLALLLIFALFLASGAAIRNGEAGDAVAGKTESLENEVNSAFAGAEELKVSNQGDDLAVSGIQSKQETIVEGTTENDQASSSGKARESSTAENEQPNSVMPVMTSEEEERYSARPSSVGAIGFLPIDGSVGFFGVEATGEDIAYVIDISSSMAGTKAKLAQQELTKALAQLSEDQMFSIYFFNSSVRYDSKFIDCKATKDNLKKNSTWLKTINSSGGTNPIPAIGRAFIDECDEIFLLSDGEFSPGTEAQIVALNTHETRINTISLGSGSASLKQIANQSCGQYIPVKN